MLDDRRRCPHCQRDMCEKPYLMSRRAITPVLSPRTVAWVVAVALVLLIVTAH